jgi:hypothetical protein
LRDKTNWFSRFGYTRAHHQHFLFPVPNFHNEFLTSIFSSPFFFSRVLPASRLLLRVILRTLRRASAFTRWAPHFWEVVCDEHGIGGDGEYCGNNDAHFDRINVT